MTEQTPGHSGSEMMEYARRLFPICRSLTGDGVRETLRIIKEICGDLEVYEVPTGTKVFDWEIPEEWNIRDAYIIDPDGKKIADFKENNLHVMGYSPPLLLPIPAATETSPSERLLKVLIGFFSVMGL
jgi:aminopeptidase-like protein